MTSVKILLNSIEHVKEFVNIVSHFDAEMELIYGRYVIDAKSIMGIFSLNLSEPVELHIHADGRDVEKILGQMKKYFVRGSIGN